MVTKKEWSKFADEAEKYGKKAMAEWKKLAKKAQTEINKGVLQTKITLSEQKIGSIIHKKKIKVSDAAVNAELAKIAKFEKEMKTSK